MIWPYVLGMSVKNAFIYVLALFFHCHQQVHFHLLYSGIPLIFFS